MARREFDQVAAWSVDRLGRSLQDLVTFLGELHAKGVDLYLHQQGIDTATPAGKAMFQMGVFAEFERAMIVERVNAGLARAKAQGKTLGRPSALNPGLDATAAQKRRALAIEHNVLKMLAKGDGIVKIGKALGVGTGTVQRIKASMEGTGAAA